MKQQITEADHLEKEWFEEAKKQTIETLPKFINHLMDDYIHDYGTWVKAVAAAMLGTFWVFNDKDGFTGFQVGFIPWMMANEFWGKSAVGRKVIDYDKMLYPQYEFKFQKTISKDVFKRLQEEAKKELSKGYSMSANVKQHMESIVAGVIPFGYTIGED